MGEIQEFVLPDGRKAIWDETVGGYFIEGTETETLLKGMETVQMKGLHTLAVKRLRQLVHVVFWSLVFLVLKSIISIADRFDNYAAKPTAQKIGETFGFASSLLVLVLVLFIILCLLWVFGIDFWNGLKHGKTMPEVPANIAKKKEGKKRLKPIDSGAQHILKSNK